MLTADIAVWAGLIASRDQGRILAWSAVGAGIGLYLFYRGFCMLQFKRLVLNTPLSKVRGASMGLVELSGMAVGPIAIPAGVTGDPCYYYRATAWELRQSGNSRQWKQVANESLFVPFFLQDETGRMLVNAQGADMDVHCNFKDEFGGSFFSSGDMPMGPAEDFLLRYGIAGRHVRVEEYCIKPDYPLFVLGTLCETHTPVRSVPERHLCSASSPIRVRRSSLPGWYGLFGMLGTRINGAQMESGDVGIRTSAAQGPRASTGTARPAAVGAPVTSSWASVSMDEVHPPVRAAKAMVAAGSIAQMDSESEREPDQMPAPASNRPNAAISLPDTSPLDSSPSAEFDVSAGVAIGAGDGGNPFTISSESQRELVRALGWKSTACIWGGPALTITCVYLLLLTLGWL
jgi:hypothetical protein